MKNLLQRVWKANCTWIFVWSLLIFLPLTYFLRGWGWEIKVYSFPVTAICGGIGMSVCFDFLFTILGFKWRVGVEHDPKCWSSDGMKQMAMFGVSIIAVVLPGLTWKLLFIPMIVGLVMAVVPSWEKGFYTKTTFRWVVGISLANSVLIAIALGYISWFNS